MSDEPKTYAALLAENAALRAEIGHLQTSLGSAQAMIVARDAELFRALNPKPKTIVLDKNATDSFRRPAYRR